jgi:hypothetical protein
VVVAPVDDGELDLARAPERPGRREAPEAAPHDHDPRHGASVPDPPRRATRSDARWVRIGAPARFRSASPSAAIPRSGFERDSRVSAHPVVSVRLRIPGDRDVPELHRLAGLAPLRTLALLSGESGSGRG